MRSHHAARGAGFTLLEMMVALAILAIGLMWLVDASSHAISAANHAKMLSTATFLARARLVELEDELQEKGFTDDSFTKETSGDFEDKGFKRFKWTSLIDKVELPSTDQVQGMVSKAIEAKQQGASGSDPFSATSTPTGAGAGGGGSAGLLGAGAGILTSQFGIIKDVLEQGIRRAHVTIAWDEFGKTKTIEIVEFLTDPRRVDMAVQMPTIPGQNGQPPNGSGPNGTSNNTQPATSNFPPPTPSRIQ